MFVCLFVCLFVYSFDLLNKVEDWDTFEKLLDYMYAKNIKSESALHPVVMSEASVSDTTVPWNHQQNLMKYWPCLFEDWIALFTG